MTTINMLAPMGLTGYGIVSQYLLRELGKLGYDISLWPKGNIQICTGIEDIELVKKSISNTSKCDFDIFAPCFNIWHQNDLMNHVGKGPYIAYSFFELDTLNKKDIVNMSVPDVMCVSSKWAADITKKFIPNVDVRILPCGVDSNVFYPFASDKFKKDRPDTYTFFNIGKWEKRKGHDIICSAFNKAFTKDDNVELVMVPHNPFLNANELAVWIGMYTKSKLSSKIKILESSFKSHSMIADLINAFDCGVFPARAEGWNMELLETMACGKPVITTNVTAHKEYCSKENSLLIDAPNMEEAFDGKFFFGGGNWAELDYEEEEQLIEYMRYCYRERPANDGGLVTAKQFSWESSAEILNKIIKSVC